MKMVNHKTIAISSHYACAVNFYHMSGHYGGNLLWAYVAFPYLQWFDHLYNKWSNTTPPIVVVKYHSTNSSKFYQ